MPFQQFNVYPTLTPVRLVSTSNVSGTYSNGSSNNGVGATLTVAASSLTIDSVACAVGDRVLLHTQTNTYEQGIYVVTSIGSTVVLTRSADLQCNEQLKAGMNVAVAAGSLNAGNFYTLVEPLPAQLGIDALVFNADPGAGSVSFSGAASTANALPVFSDTAGNIKAATGASTFGQNLAITGTLSSTGNFSVSAGTITASGAIASTAGNITSGSSGDAGTFISFPATASRGSLIVAAVNNTGNDNVTISNAVHGQASVYSIPDGGQATSEFIIADSAGTQNITSGNLTVDAGAISSGLAAGGFAGRFNALSNTAAQGQLSLLAVDNGGGDFDTIISNAASVGQDQTITIPDSGSATANFLLTKNAGTQTIATGSLALTVGDVTATAGDLVAGSSGNAGVLKSFPGTAANGFLSLTAVDAGGAFNTIISNRAMGQTTTFSLGDPGQATASILTSKVNADVGANLISFDVTCGQAALAAGGSVTLIDSSGSKQYKVRNLWINSGGTNFSGGGGDRLGQVTDGTTVYSVVPATDMQTLVNAGWGMSTPLPFPASAAINTSTAAGADLVFKYSGGGTDYTAGSIVVSGIVERVA